jgi:hypothetical protein
MGVELSVPETFPSPGGCYTLPGPDLHRLEHASFAWRTDSIRIAAWSKMGNRYPVAGLNCRIAVLPPVRTFLARNP